MFPTVLVKVISQSEFWHWDKDDFTASIFEDIHVYIYVCISVYIYIFAIDSFESYF